MNRVKLRAVWLRGKIYRVRDYDVTPYRQLCSLLGLFFPRNDMSLVKEKSPSPLLKGEGRGEGLFIMSLRTGIKSFVVEIKNSRECRNLKHGDN